MTNNGHYIKMVKNNQKHLHLLVKFSILGTVINQNYIHVEVKTRINLGNSIEFIHAYIHTQKHKYTRTHTHTHIPLIYQSAIWHVNMKQVVTL